jgi:hypothetical protein
MRDHVLPIVTRAAADQENARWLAAWKLRCAAAVRKTTTTKAA